MGRPAFLPGNDWPRSQTSNHSRASVSSSKHAIEIDNLRKQYEERLDKVIEDRDAERKEAAAARIDMQKKIDQMMNVVNNLQNQTKQTTNSSHNDTH